jgi:hypothetical protein
MPTRDDLAVYNPARASTDTSLPTGYAPWSQVTSYTPSTGENIGNWLHNLTGSRSIADKAEMGWGMTPMAAAEDAGYLGGSGAKTQAAISAIGAIPEAGKALAVGGHGLAMFLGPRSQLFDRKMADLAQEMASKGATRDEIWKATGSDKIAGTMLGPRGEPMQEISDVGARFNDPSAYSDKAPDFTAGDVFHHPAGYEAYPELANTEFNWRNSANVHGSYTRGDPPSGYPPTAEVSLYAPDKPGTMLHENFTHGVQDIENWPKGGNTNFLNPGTPAWDIYQERLKAINTPMSPQTFESSGLSDPQFTYDDYLKQHNDALKNPTHSRMLDRVAQEEAVNEAYQRSAGEAQARNVQARKDMTLDQLKATPPWETQDIPTDRQIATYPRDAGPQFSRTDLAGQMLRDYPGDPAAVTPKGKNPEWFHGVSGGPKLPTPFSELTSTTVPTEGSAMLADKPMSPEDFQRNSWLLPLYGDKSIAGQTLVDVNGQPLATPQNLGGGGRFMQANPGALWASDQSKGTKITGKVQALEQESGLPVNATHVIMGPTSGDFAHMTARPLLQLTDQKAISSDQARAFDDRMVAEGVNNWPGIRNVGEDWLNAPGTHRAALAKTMQLAPFANDPAFGNVAAVRKAITEPELMHAPMLTSGMTVGQFAPGGAVVPGAGTHETYNTDWLGQHIGNMGQVPFSKMFPDVLSGYLAKNPALAGNLPTIGYSVERQIPAQKLTQQWLDNIMPWWERRNSQ